MRHTRIECDAFLLAYHTSTIPTTQQSKLVRIYVSVIATTAVAGPHSTLVPHGCQPRYPCSSTTPTTCEPLAMARTTRPVATPRNPTRGEAAIQEFANSSLTSEQLKQRATPLLNSKELLRDVQGLTPEDQTRFVDKVDQVGRDGSSFSPKNLPSIIFCEGISYHRLAKCKIRNRLGERVQCNRATSDFSRALHRTRETWQYCSGIWRTD